MLKKDKKLLDQVRDRIRVKNYSPKTAESYTYWIREYILHHNKTHPKEMGDTEINQFLSYLATERNVAPSTQNQAFSALLFLYREVLTIPIEVTYQYMGAKKPERLPIVLTKTEVTKTIQNIVGVPAIVAKLLYGSGLRLNEAITLRVKDIDFEQQQIVVRDGKGWKDR
ncbi:MAG: tyrosine-type recombinase/integrase, partial [Deltaproteobacteria bacterium]|nr:tyrosine-type recombinase/integrase [Deltaproteobacteria bacterium]